MSKVTLCEAGSDEHGKNGYEEHSLGDQTGREVRFSDYYSKPWNVVLRCNNIEIANAIATRCAQAADNPMCGYGQPTRYTAFDLLLINPDPSKIAEPVDFDCSSLVSIMTYITLKTCGIKTTITGCETTRTMKNHFLASGYFTDVFSQVNLETGAGLKRGDIVLREGKHTAIVWEPEEVTSPEVQTKQGKVVTALYLRKTPLTGAAVTVLPENAIIDIISSVKASNGATWYQTTYNGKSGYCSAKYVKLI